MKTRDFKQLAIGGRVSEQTLRNYDIAPKNSDAKNAAGLRVLIDVRKNEIDRMKAGIIAMECEADRFEAAS